MLALTISLLWQYLVQFLFWLLGCHNKPCKSGGTCIEGPEENGSFTCLCLPEYSGSTCTEVKGNTVELLKTGLS